MSETELAKVEKLAVEGLLKCLGVEATRLEAASVLLAYCRDAREPSHGVGYASQQPAGMPAKE